MKTNNSFSVGYSLWNDEELLTSRVYYHVIVDFEKKGTSGNIIIFKTFFWSMLGDVALFEFGLPNQMTSFHLSLFQLSQWVKKHFKQPVVFPMARRENSCWKNSPWIANKSLHRLQIKSHPQSRKNVLW